DVEPVQVRGVNGHPALVQEVGQNILPDRRNGITKGQSTVGRFRNGDVAGGGGGKKRRIVESGCIRAGEDRVSRENVLQVRPRVQKSQIAEGVPFVGGAGEPVAA